MIPECRYISISIYLYIEVSDTIIKLKMSKACRADGICVETLKSTHHKVYVFFYHCSFLCVCLMVICHIL